MLTRVVFIRHQMEENTETGLNSNKKCVFSYCKNVLTFPL